MWVCSHRSQIEGITFYLWQSLKSYLPYLKFARGFQAASAQAQFYAQRSRIHLSALWRRWTCSTNKTKTSPVLCSSAASKHTQRTHVYVRGLYRLLFISIPVPLQSFVKASQNPPAKLYLKPKVYTPETSSMKWTSVHINPLTPEGNCPRPIPNSQAFFGIFQSKRKHKNKRCMQ